MFGAGHKYRIGCIPVMMNMIEILALLALLCVRTSLSTPIYQTIIGTFAGKAQFTDLSLSGRTSTYVGSVTDVKGDILGNIYVTDSQNHRVLKVSAATNIVSKIAGVNGEGWLDGDGGPASSSHVKVPFGLFVRSNGDVYIADRENHRIRRIDHSDGNIYTVVGSGSTGLQGTGGDGGPATMARLMIMRSLALDSDGNIYFSSDGTVRKVDRSTGIITRIAGPAPGDGNTDDIYVDPSSQPATSTDLDFPTGIALDTLGNVYLSEYTVHIIRKVDATTGILSQVAGGSGDHGFVDGAALQARFFYPGHLWYSTVTNSLYIADLVNCRIRKLDLNGIVSTVAGNGQQNSFVDNSIATSTAIGNVNYLYGDQYDNIYMTDNMNNQIYCYNSTTNKIKIIAAQEYISNDDVPAPIAFLNSPLDITLDNFGNLYFIDSFSETLRKIYLPTNIMSTVAGPGLQSYAGNGGPATSAYIGGSSVIATDSNGNVYLGDNSDYRVRVINATTGQITEIAGSGSIGVDGYSGDNGPATLARLFNPNAVVIDGSGIMYVADTLNNRVRRVDEGAGIITTAVGTGSSATNTHFNNVVGTAINIQSPSFLALDTSDNLYISDALQYVWVFNPTGAIGSVLLGTGASYLLPDGLSAASSNVRTPTGIFVDSTGTIYFADGDNHRIRIINAEGNVETLAGSGLKGVTGSDDGVTKPATSAIFNKPVGMAISSSGDVYIVDENNNQVRYIRQTDSAIVQVFGGGSGYTGILTGFPTGLTFDTAGTLYVASRQYNIIQRVENGIISIFAGGPTNTNMADNGPAANAMLNSCQDVWADSNSNLFIADTNHFRIRKVDRTNDFITTVVGSGSSGDTGDNVVATAATICTVTKIAGDSLGNVYLADTSCHRVRRYFDGRLYWFAGNGAGGAGTNEVLATVSKLSSPAGLTVDMFGNVYIADTGNHRIRKVTKVNNIITNYAGNGAPALDGDNGPATAASLMSPRGICIDTNLNLYIADSSNFRVRKVNSNGIITMIAGKAYGANGFSDGGGVATYALLNSPMGLFVDSIGRLYFADKGNFLVRQVTGPIAPTSSPSMQPSTHPSVQPSAQPTTNPSTSPSSIPTTNPTNPSSQPTSNPSRQPSSEPSTQPFSFPSCQPSMQPFARPSGQPSLVPSTKPSVVPSSIPSNYPTALPTLAANSNPSSLPSSQPSCKPSMQPFAQPSTIPSTVPSVQPTLQPVCLPTSCPSSSPSNCPTLQPFSTPSTQPSQMPSSQPSSIPTLSPSLVPTILPTSQPTFQPQNKPSNQPSTHPTSQPSIQPSNQPLTLPTAKPSSQPTRQPFVQPSSQPSMQPSAQPTGQPAIIPTGLPSGQPTSYPTAFDRFNPEVVNIELSKLMLSSSTFAVSKPAQVQNVVSALIDTVFDRQLIGNTTELKVFEFNIGATQFALALFPPTSGSNSSTVQFFPTLQIPGSAGSINIANNGQGGGAVAAVVDHNSYAAVVNNSNINATEFISSLVSNIVSVRLVYLNKSIDSSPPSFVANISILPQANNQSNNVPPVFVHNCTLGVRENILFHCLGANVLMNLTCSGGTAATVRRQCPVSRAVCSVVNLKDLKEESNDYCVTASVSPNFVVCRCGLDNIGKRNDSGTDGGPQVGPSDSVNVAVMSKYFAGDFSSTISISSSVGSGNIAEKSTSIYIVFGALWGIGLLIIGSQFHQYHQGDSDWKIRKKKQQIAAVDVLPAAILVEEGGGGRGEEDAMEGMAGKEDTRKLLRKYLLEVLPGVFHPKPWYNRLQEEIMKCHGTVSVFLTIIGYAQEEVWSLQGARKAALEIAQFLSTITISFFLLALLYDFQVPNDDGSCSINVDQSSCLQRTSPLDASQTYCTWTPFVNQTAGFLVESKNGVPLQNIPLATVYELQMQAQCEYRVAGQSSQAFIIVAVITSCCSLIAMYLLAFLFRVISAKTKEEDRIKKLMKNVHMAADNGMLAVVPTQQRGRSSAVFHPSQGSFIRKSSVMPSMSTSIAMPSIVDSLSPIQIVLYGLDQLFQLQLNTSNNIIAVPSSLRHARNEFLAAFRKTFPLSSSVYQKPTEGSVIMENIPIGWQKKLQVLQQKANDGEYGVSILHAVIVELLGTDSNAARLFQHTVLKDFVEEMPPVAKYWQWLAILLVIMFNAGSLFFIVLKGIQRGVSWQQSYLYACLLQVVLDIILVETLEVFWIDFGVPSLIFKEVMEKGLYKLQLVADNFLKSLHHLQAEYYTRETNASSTMMFSTVLAYQHIELLESMIAVFHANFNVGNNASLPLHGIRANLLYALAIMPLGLQRFCVRIATPFVFGGVSLTFVALDRLENGKLYFLLLMLMLAFVCTLLFMAFVSQQQLNPLINKSRSDDELFALDDERRKSDTVPPPLEFPYLVKQIPEVEDKNSVQSSRNGSIKPGDNVSSSDDSSSSTSTQHDDIENIVAQEVRCSAVLNVDSNQIRVTNNTDVETSKDDDDSIDFSLSTMSSDEEL